MKTDRQIIDVSALKTNQTAIIVLVLLGFIIDQPVIPLCVAAILIAGSLRPGLALFKQVYVHVFKPLGLVRARPINDSAAPHEFAQLLGGCILACACACLFAGYPAAGWPLAWMVVLLAAANLFFGFCAGCFVYYQLGKLGVPGFMSRTQ